ncbi:MAG: 50S ribosomal protein L11 methyltransferase [Rhizobiaceae bacterium]|nr:50S ribosomal protein L11 methyltransferase [Rhizobiaceae bacterium]MCV0406581.1 50S ribosomal protein L11 methyltransferase [Rhizobiaceae bacterium]
MTQTRYFIRLPRAEAEAAFAALEVAFEDDGFALDRNEVDEDAEIDEVSLDADEGQHMLSRIRAALPAAREIGTEPVPEIDWVAASLTALKPVRAGRFLVHGAHDRAARRAGDVAIEIEAGLAFGTGHHGTTAGCLMMLGDILRRERPRSALDLGAGSAVLAIAVARLARIPVLATDIDPVATRVAAENARHNGVGSLVATATATGFRHATIAGNAPYDLIVANILARPLMALAPDMARHVAPDGSVVLSGILDRQRNAVLAAYVGQRFRHMRTIRLGGWSTLHLKR